ncbi:MAG: crossover junction endodeoxyribonuclease RuvC [Patescibacteria group bacterium]|jgi:crossover junction endodeoxyribonuclease RuvC|nr:crossover junction endodeoxyribonuclease RuvC [Patescibacteria group bacterium]MDD5172739.1 crossover junction endodeoxyribonuclease RuvC [Patescibacteria group bacterium]
MIILGIDPGIAIVGYAILVFKKNKFFVSDYGCVRTSSQKIFSQRILQIYQEIDLLIKKYKPNIIAIETIFFAKNAKTAMKVSESRGIAALLAAQNDITIKEYTPLQVKQALTGYGRASKEQIQKMVKSILCLEKIPQPDDVADALAIAITCAQTKNFNL